MVRADLVAKLSAVVIWAILLTRRVRLLSWVFVPRPRHLDFPVSWIASSTRAAWGCLNLAMPWTRRWLIFQHLLFGNWFCSFCNLKQHANLLCHWWHFTSWWIDLKGCEPNGTVSIDCAWAMVEVGVAVHWPFGRDFTRDLFDHIVSETLITTLTMAQAVKYASKILNTGILNSEGENHYWFTIDLVPLCGSGREIRFKDTEQWVRSWDIVANHDGTQRERQSFTVSIRAPAPDMPRGHDMSCPLVTTHQMAKPTAHRLRLVLLSWLLSMRSPHSRWIRVTRIPAPE